jgi:hypothetical protein
VGAYAEESKGESRIRDETCRDNRDEKEIGKRVKSSSSHEGRLCLITRLQTV